MYPDSLSTLSEIWITDKPQNTPSISVCSWMQTLAFRFIEQALYLLSHLSRLISFFISFGGPVILKFAKCFWYLAFLSSVSTDPILMASANRSLLYLVFNVLLKWHGLMGIGSCWLHFHVSCGTLLCLRWNLALASIPCMLELGQDNEPISWFHSCPALSCSYKAAKFAPPFMPLQTLQGWWCLESGLCNAELHV